MSNLSKLDTVAVIQVLNNFTLTIKKIVPHHVRISRRLLEVVASRFCKDKLDSV
jgi:hypothetical protein